MRHGPIWRLLGAFLFALTAFTATPTTRTVAQDPCDGVEPTPGTDITLALVRSGIPDPVDVTAPADDFDRIFVVQQSGRIRIVNLSDYSDGGDFLDIRSKVRGGGERGLLSMAFHPAYSENGYFYVYYTRSAGAICSAAPPPGCSGSRDGESVIARYEVSAENPNRADPASEVILLSFCQPFGNHNGGQILFGPHDGLLYIGTGDGGSGGDPCNSGQRTDTFLGKILRIDVNSGEPYGIPPDNPFVGDPSVLDEIWALGVRNPWRYAFDRGAPDETRRGDIYIADVGQNVWEEVDYVAVVESGGENFQWRRLEGDHSFNTGTALSVGESTGPIYEYQHGGGVFRGCSVTGGRVYRGCALPDLHGTYFFADYCNNWIGTFEVDDAGQLQNLTNRTAALNRGLSPSIAAITAFGEDAAGEVYVCSQAGRVYKIVPFVPNVPPTARVVSDPTPPVVLIQDGSANVALDGGTSDDGGDGPRSLTYRWHKESGPDGDEIAETREASTLVSFARPGEYSYSLVVSDGADSDEAMVTVTVEVRFQRGNTNGDASTDVSDAITIVNHLFLSSPPVVPCAEALNTDDDSALILTDAIYLLNHLFLGGPVPPAPYPECGVDETPDVGGVGCEDSLCQ